MAKGETSTKDEPFSPAAKLFHAPRLNCYIIAIMGCKTKINPSVIKAGLEQTLIKHPRFSSKLVIDDVMGGKKIWFRTTVNIEGHVIVPDMDPVIDSPNQFVEDYISNLTTMSMDLSKPLWEVHLLNVKTSEAEAVVVFRIHHSIGDGMSLMSLLLACTRKTSDPEALPSLPLQKQKSSSVSSRFWLFILAIWSALRIILNTIVDVIVFVATTLFLKDTKTPLKGAPGVEHKPKRIVHKTISLDDIKLVKNAMNMTVNDVVLGVTQAGLSQYLNQRYGEDEKNGVANHKSNNLPEKIRLNATILVNIRPTVGIQALADMMAKESKAKWGNRIGYILLPFTIALQEDPLDYVGGVKATIDRKRLSLEALCTFQSAKLVLQSFGVKAGAALMHRILSNTTMAFSNMVGPLEEISLYGHPMAYLAPTVYGHPHALTIHIQSYINKMTICVAVDPSVIRDSHQLCDYFEESLKIIKNAVLEKGLIQQALADMMAKESKAKWGNKIGYILLLFTIALQDDPLDYVRGAKATIDRKKLSLETICTFSSAKLIQQLFGVKAAAALTHRIFSNTTMAFSNVVGPLEEISFYGHPMASDCLWLPHALTIHIQSYINKMTICVAVDPSVIPDPHQLCADFEESLKTIKNAVIEKGLVKETA